MKRCIGAFIVAILCIFAMKPVNALAAEYVKLNVNSPEVKPGEIVDLTVTIEENPGIASLGYRIYYDESIMTYLSDSEGTFSDSSYVYSNVSDGSGTFVQYFYVSAFNNDNKGVTSTFSFKVKEGIQDTYVRVELDKIESYNEDLKNVMVVYNTSDIKISNKIDDNNKPIVEEKPTINNSADKDEDKTASQGSDNSYSYIGESTLQQEYVISDGTGQTYNISDGMDVDKAVQMVEKNLPQASVGEKEAENSEKINSNTYVISGSGVVKQEEATEVSLEEFLNNNEKPDTHNVLIPIICVVAAIIIVGIVAYVILKRRTGIRR